MTSHPDDHSGWKPPEKTGETAGAPPPSANVVDPEDDIGSPNYGGDLETTAIPRATPPAGSDKNPAEHQGFGLVSEPEPLPYLRPGGHPLPSHPAEPIQIEPDEVAHDRITAAGRRGTQDLGLMLLRIGLGVLLIAHGLQKTFGWWGGEGLGGFRDTLADSGYRYAEALTYVGAATQVGAGVLLVLGLFTPLAAAAALAYLINALLVGLTQQPGESGYFPFFLPDGHEFVVTLIVVTAAIILTGPGRYGLDAGRGWARRPFVGSFVALLLGIGAGVAVWLVLNGTNPLG